MHLVLLPAFLIALLSGAFGGSTAHTLLNPRNDDPSIRSFYSVAAQTTVTATATTPLTSTGTITATATTTGTVAQNTPPPLPSGPVAGNTSLRINPLDWDFLNSAPAPQQVMGPFAWLFLVIMLALFGVSVYIYFFKRIEWKRTNSVLRRAAERWGPWFMWVSGIGLAFIVLRVVQLDILNKRLWLYLTFLAMLALIGWFYYWYRTALPQQIAKYEKTQRAKQYMPGSAAKKGSMRSPALTPRPGTSTAPSPTSGSPSSTTRVVPADSDAATGSKKRRRRR